MSEQLIFRAVEGTQWNKRTYSAQFPFDKLDELTTVDEDRQRAADPKRFAEIGEYILDGLSGKGTAGFNAIAVSLRKDPDDPNKVLVHYDNESATLTILEEGVRFYICDGQHRVGGSGYAIAKASRLRFEAKEEGDRESWRDIFSAFSSCMMPVLIYTDLTLEEEAQIFADMNRLVKPVNQSKALKHDERDMFNRLAKSLAVSIPKIAEFGIASEAKMLPDKRGEVATLATWNRVIRIMANGSRESELVKDWEDVHLEYDETKREITEFWNDFLTVVPKDYNNRSKYMISKSVYLQGIAAWAHALKDYDAAQRKAFIQKLSDFNWNYSNAAYSRYGGGSLNPVGKMQFVGTRAAIKAIPRVLNDHVGIPNEQHTA